MKTTTVKALTAALVAGDLEVGYAKDRANQWRVVIAVNDKELWVLKAATPWAQHTALAVNDKIVDGAKLTKKHWLQQPMRADLKVYYTRPTKPIDPAKVEKWKLAQAAKNAA